MQLLRKNMILPKLKRALILTSCFFVSARGVAHAQTNTDELAGVFISAIAIDPQNNRIVYAASAKGVLKSTDDGVSWSAPGSDLPTGVTALVVDPKNPDILWAAAYNDYNDGLFKSLNGGINWTKVINLVGAWTIVVNPQNPDLVSVGAGYGDIGSTPGIVNSIDGGNSWHFTSALNIYALAVDPQNPSTIYAGGREPITSFSGKGRLVKSTDGGEHWTVPTAPWPFGYILSLVVDPKNPNTIYAGTGSVGLPATGGAGIVKSTDGGSNWVSVTANYGANSVGRLIIDPNDTNVLYATWSGSASPLGLGLWKTTDGGETWKAISQLEGAHINALAIDPKISQSLYLGTESGVWKSGDGGSTWSANSEFPILSLGYASCVGGHWYLRVSNALPNSSIQLFGTSNGESWQISNWRTAYSDRWFEESGTFGPETLGSHSLYVNVGGLNSNTVSFVVSSCKR
jgi:photosystem II stability/assembly factor-like uncharacterized protein